MVFLCCVLLSCLSARPGEAVPVVAEARVRAADGDVHGAARAAADAAVVEAVHIVVRRHVSPSALVQPATAVRRAVLKRAPRYVLHYAIAEERWDDLEVTVRVEAEVDRERVLQRLTESGVPVGVLAVKPRLLLVPLDPAAQGALGPLAATLEAAGYLPRLGGVPAEGAFVLSEAPEASGGTVDAERVGGWARSTGCHLTLVLQTATTSTDAPSAAWPTLPRAWTVRDAWLDPGGEPERRDLLLVGWLVDPSGRLPVEQLEAAGAGRGGDAAAAERDAAVAAGRQLGYAALGVLETSGWTLEGAPAALSVHVSGLVDPLLVEEIGAALDALPEVRRVQLTGVSSRRADWSLDVMDAGLDWVAVLAMARLPRGQLVWDAENAVALPGPKGALVDAELVLAARWQGP